jgi:hypothetical protein
MVHGFFLGMLTLVFLGCLWYLQQRPRCQFCQVALRPIDEVVRPWGRFGVEAIFVYECPSCARTTERHQTVTHFD